MSNSSGGGEPGNPPAEVGAAGDHLVDVEDGCGCVEIWERLSERRSSD